jgi:ubiquitin-protein ligase
MLTPVFHPNIAPHTVCIGDHWSAGQSLDMLIQRVGEMLSFQSYNIKSPLNGRAARWVEENMGRLPLEREDFFIDLSAAAAQRRASKP